MIDAAFAALIEVLPHCAEEGHLATQINAASLIEHVAQESGIALGEATAIVATTQRILDSLAVLDRRLLQDGSWQFVSFPAQLVANSLLTGLADENKFFLNPIIGSKVRIDPTKSSKSKGICCGRWSRGEQWHIASMQQSRFAIFTWHGA
ncbi:MAG: hypothetical protein WAS49_01495 [Candidatus Dechloromonas phosphoritropha]|nr:hypothetical protein [Azonexus sp.]